MANPMFGWSAQDVFVLVQTCNRLIEAYRNGPGGASMHLRSFALQVQSCQAILTSIHDELQQQEREFFYSKFRRDSLKETLEQCEKVFVKSEFLKPAQEQKKLSKAAAAVQWLWCDEEKVQKLSKILEGHINYIQVFLQLLQSKNTQKQIAHLESHGKHLEVQTQILQRHDQHLQRQGEHLQEIRDLLLSHQEPRWLSQSVRAQSVVNVPSASSSSAVAHTEVYIQTRKQLTDVEDLLEQVSSELHDPQRTEEEKVVLQNVQKELEDVEERINKSLERNEAKGVQIARQNRENRERRRSRAVRQDSGYPASMNDFDVYRTSQYSISSASSTSTTAPSDRVLQSSLPREPDGPPHSPSYGFKESNSAASGHRPSRSQSDHRASFASDSSNWSQVVKVAIQQAPESNPELYRSVQICQAEILFNDGKHKAMPLPCICYGKYKDDWLCQIFPEYAGRLLGRWEAPAIMFNEHWPRPVPHTTPRGPNAVAGRYPVQLMGKAKIVPDMKGLQYIFKTPEDSRLFQELVFNKELVLEDPITVHKIRSGRDKESDAVALRFWKTRNIMPTRKDYSLLYHANDVGRPVKEHIEISLDDIETLIQEKKKHLKVQFKTGSPAGEKVQFLEFQLARKVADENEKDRAILVKYLDPKGLPAVR